MKTIITASVKTTTAQALQKVTKGNRSNVVDRAISEYLKQGIEFTVQDVPTKRLASVLMARLQSENNWQHTPLSLGLWELIQTLDDDTI